MENVSLTANVVVDILVFLMRICISEVKMQKYLFNVISDDNHLNNSSNEVTIIRNHLKTQTF